MVQKKKPPLIKWNPYSLGETRSVVMKEINQLVSKKEHRRKIGLETGAFREFKGNSHWNLFVTIELIELLTKRLNNDIKNVYLQTNQGLNNTSTFLNSISQQLKKTEYNLGNVTTVSNNNVMKIIRSEVGKLDKVVDSMEELQKNIQTTNDKIEEELGNTSKLLKETLDKNLQNIFKELCDRNEASQTIITDDIQTLKDLQHNKFGELNDLVKVNFSEFNEQMTSIDSNNAKSFKSLSEQLANLESLLKATDERVVTFQEATNNMLDDTQNLMVSEFQEGIGGLMKQNLENIENLKKSEASQTKKVIGRVDETSENITSIIEATNEHMNKLNAQTKDNLKSSESEIKKEFKGEITDIRAILSTIRSDIELMKSVLTKIDTKIH
jgi:hypothetical protein